MDLWCRRKIYANSIHMISRRCKPHIVPVLRRVIETVNRQGRSQPHNLEWERVPLSSLFPQILINFPLFPQMFLIFFLILAFRVGESPTRKGPGYATVNRLIVKDVLNSSFCVFLFAAGELFYQYFGSSKDTIWKHDLITGKKTRVFTGMYFAKINIVHYGTFYCRFKTYLASPTSLQRHHQRIVLIFFRF